MVFYHFSKYVVLLIKNTTRLKEKVAGIFMSYVWKNFVHPHVLVSDCDT